MKPAGRPQDANDKRILLARHVAAVHTRKCPSNCKPQRAPEWAPFSPTETDCMAGHVKVPLLNANNGLQKGAGVQVPLSAKRYFRRFPHLKPRPQGARRQPQS